MEEQKKEQLQHELEEHKKLCEEYLDGWKRAKADLANYKKDEDKRFRDFAAFNQADLMSEMLTVLDSFDRATDLPEGAHLIRQQMEEALKRSGLEEIEVRPGQLFDPALHEAFEEEESEEPSGTLLGTVLKGYRLNGRVLRAAKVKVSSQKAN